jgi:hypothetical protein
MEITTSTIHFCHIAMLRGSSRVSILLREHGETLASGIRRWRGDINDLALRELHSPHNIPLVGRGSAIFKMFDVADIGFGRVSHCDDSIVYCMSVTVAAADRGGKSVVYIKMPRMLATIPSQLTATY